MIDDTDETTPTIKINDILHTDHTSNTFLNIQTRAAHNEFYVNNSNLTSETIEYTILISNIFNRNVSCLKIVSYTFYTASPGTIKSTIKTNKTVEYHIQKLLK